MAPASVANPPATLSVFDAVSIMIGAVVGIGIFKTPSLVAANVDTGWAFIGVWLLGGLVTLLGALCYAELASANPHSGGEYHFLSRAFGRPMAVLFGWARGSVIQTGAIGAVAFVFGDYAAQVVPLGPFGVPLYAAGAVIVLTGVNLLGTLRGKLLQNIMTLLLLATLLALIVAGFSATPVPPTTPPVTQPALASGSAALGMAMIFVLLTYGGWNEAAYLSAEVRDARRNMARVLLAGTAVLTTIYLLVNAALLWVLGLDGLRASNAVAADMMRAAAGDAGALFVSIAVIAAALCTLNATIFTGARVYSAAARDLSIVPGLARWSDGGVTPASGLLLQGAVALVLVGLGAATRSGFEAMVAYTAPVFWSFMFLVGLSLIVLRRKEPERVIPFRVPLYPIVPALFCLSSLGMLYSSIAYTGVGALVGLGVVMLGTPLLFFTQPAGAEAQRNRATVPAK